MQNPHRPNQPTHPMSAQQLQHQQPLQQQQQPPPTPQQQSSQPPPQIQAQPAVAPPFQFEFPPPYNFRPVSNYGPMPMYPQLQPPPWPTTGHFQQPAQQTQRQTIRKREPTPATVKYPDTKKTIELKQLSKGRQPQTTQSIANNDTTTVNTTAGQTNPTNIPTSSKPATIKAPSTAILGQTSSKSTQVAASATVKSPSKEQLKTAPAKSPATDLDGKNDAPVSSERKSAPNVETTDSVTILTATSDKVTSNVASSLAVQNEFACKASERLVGLESVSYRSGIKLQENKKIGETELSTQDKVDNKIVTSKAIVDDKLEKVNEDGKNIESVATDQSRVGETDNNYKHKGDEEVSEAAADHEKTACDDSNKENVDGSDLSDEWAALHYEPGQYNPKTKSGKRKYSKKFLMTIREIIDKEDKSDIPSIPQDPIDRFKPLYCANQGMDIRPADPLRRQNQPYYGGRSSDRQERQKKIIPTSSLGQEVELKTTSNPWKPASVIKDETKVDEAVADIENLKKQFRSILNKLTPNNFDSLAEKVTRLHIDTEDKLGDVIDIVFAKALSEPGYSVLYGRMCSHLKKISPKEGVEFGTILLKRCQNQFQSDIYSGVDVEGRKKKIGEEEDPTKKKHLEEELYEDMYRCRMRGLGLIKFIGELYKIGMLNNTIMFYCIERLLIDVSDESIECLCDLLATIGKKLDESSKQLLEQEKHRKKDKKEQAPKPQVAYQCKTAAAVVAQGPAQQSPQSIATLDPIFERLQKIRKDNTNALSLRIRFKLLDVCELRDKKWESTKTKDNNLKTLEEIREDHMEKLEMEKEKRTAMGPRRSQENRRHLGHASGSSSQISSLANDHSGNRGGGMAMSHSSHSLRDHNDQMRSNEGVQKGFEVVKAHVLNRLKQASSTTDGPEVGGLRPASLRKS